MRPPSETQIVSRMPQESFKRNSKLARAAVRADTASPVAGADREDCTASKAVWEAHDCFYDAKDRYQMALAAMERSIR